MGEPMCLVGTSMGATIVSIFATKYPSCVSMICLLAPIPRKYTFFISDTTFFSLYEFSWRRVSNENSARIAFRNLSDGFTRNKETALRSSRCIINEKD